MSDVVRNLCAWASACRPHDGQACSCTCHPESRPPGTLPYGMKLLNPSQAADEG